MCRKRVTTSLQSDFCAKMNQLILSLLQRQGQYNVDDNFGEEFTMRPYWRQKYELNNSEQIASASSSLVPFQYHNNSENWQNITFTNNVSDNSTVRFESSVVHPSFLHHFLSPNNNQILRFMLLKLNSNHNLKRAVKNRIFT
jgi:hypothetical protein